jgi:hypothetical protein
MWNPLMADELARLHAERLREEARAAGAGPRHDRRRSRRPMRLVVGAWLVALGERLTGTATEMIGDAVAREGAAR